MQIYIDSTVITVVAFIAANGLGSRLEGNLLLIPLIALYLFPQGIIVTRFFDNKGKEGNVGSLILNQIPPIIAVVLCAFTIGFLPR